MPRIHVAIDDCDVDAIKIASSVQSVRPFRAGQRMETVGFLADQIARVFSVQFLECSKRLVFARSRLEEAKFIAWKSK